ncbi:MAG: ATP-dependent endonuclease [Ignavibacteriae bacterium]|nr:ATP-dependent endonuclease [Ignavibacteriota bacterium]
MNLSRVHIKNYRSCKDVKIEFGALNAFVGANNSGKSNIIRALDFLFNPSTTKLDEESFWNGDTSLEIWIEALFDKLTTEDNEILKGYLRPDGTFLMARSAKIRSEEGQETPTSEEEENNLEISQHYCKPIPIQPWLQEGEINGKNINEWWKEKDNLRVNNVSFVEFVGGNKPSVGEWQEKAKQFIRQHLVKTDFKDKWIPNPKGYPGVLKGTLPNFIFIPAVREVSDEAKVTKSNPFGKLLYAVIKGIPEEQKDDLNEYLINVQNKLNRVGGKERFQGIVDTEKRLNEILRDYMPAELEIEFESPSLETLLTTPRLLADDGFRNVIENKGHGLQRAVIFSILHCYSELVSGKGTEKKKSTIFSIEEPEIYMHPQAQRTIRRVFQKIASAQDKVIFSTHSFLLLDVAYFHEIVRVEILQKSGSNHKTVESNVWQLSMAKMIEDIEERHQKLKGQITDISMRELYSHAYHPTRSEGFFAKSVILVEGPTEQYSLPIYADALGYPLDNLNISVVDCGGKGQMDRLYRVFNELGIPCYILFDYDSSNTDKEIIKKSKELLAMVGEKTDPQEKVFVSDKLAYFPHKWEIDLANEIPEIDKLTSKARAVLSLAHDSGKPLAARYIARQLTSQKPPFVPTSINSILEKAVAIKWEKSCLVKRKI